MAPVGALVGLVVGLAIVPDGPGSGEYAAGYRVGFVARYVVLGAILFALAAKLDTQRRSGTSLSPWAPIGVAAVVLAAVLPPLLQDDGDARRKDDYRAGFISGCVRSASPNMRTEVARRYCECMHDELSDNHDTGELQRLARETSQAVEGGGRPPPEVTRAAEACARRVG
jgi:hypothetical protein